MSDTIFARSTAPGRAGVAVVRLSGPHSWDVVGRLTGRAVPPERRAVLRRIHGEAGLLDEALVIVFAPGRSFTGEAMAEVHLHGSAAVLRAVLGELGRMPGLRPAEPGEFTRRALENDRLDLTEVEGLSALLQAETEAQRLQAARLATGGLREKSAAWRAALLAILAELEVTVDFADEEVPVDLSPAVADGLARLVAEIEAEAQGHGAAAQIAEGFEVAIVGAPNAGKSTLLNRLAGREAALTSEVAGTTRDVVEVRMEIDGQLVTLLDTAGIREAEDAVERLGVDRARARAEAADLRVFLDEVPGGVAARPGDLTVRGKVDLAGPGGAELAVSGLTGAGVGALVEAIGERLSDRVAGATLAMTERQARALHAAAGSLGEARYVLREGGAQPEIVSALVREAVRSLDEMVGQIGVEDILGEIFSQFCIGK